MLIQFLKIRTEDVYNETHLKAWVLIEFSISVPFRVFTYTFENKKLEARIRRLKKVQHASLLSFNGIIKQ